MLGLLPGAEMEIDDDKASEQPQMRVYVADIPLREMKDRALRRSASSKPPVGPNPSRAFAFFPPDAKLEVVHWPKL